MVCSFPQLPLGSLALNFPRGAAAGATKAPGRTSPPTVLGARGLIRTWYPAEVFLTVGTASTTSRRHCGTTEQRGTRFQSVSVAPSPSPPPDTCQSAPVHAAQPACLSSSSLVHGGDGQGSQSGSPTESPQSSVPGATRYRLQVQEPQGSGQGLSRGGRQLCLCPGLAWKAVRVPGLILAHSFSCSARVLFHHALGFGHEL